MNDTELILQAIKDINTEIKDLRSDMNSRFEEVNEQLKEIDTSIGMLAEWADNVATVTKVPFASGSTSIK